MALSFIVRKIVGYAVLLLLIHQLYHLYGWLSFYYNQETTSLSTLTSDKNIIVKSSSLPPSKLEDVRKPSITADKTLNQPPSIPPLPYNSGENQKNELIKPPSKDISSIPEPPAAIVANPYEDEHLLDEQIATDYETQEATDFEWDSGEMLYRSFFTYDKYNQDVEEVVDQSSSGTKLYFDPDCQRDAGEEDESAIPDCARVSPTFVVAGAQKCGTTSLFMYLRRHSQVLGLSEDSRAMGKKEVRFFDKIKGYTGDIKQYLQHFPKISELKLLNLDLNQKFVVGESTPNYIRFPDAAERMRSLFPDMKVIMLLRNPIDRAYSHYQHAKRIDGPRKMYTNGYNFEVFIEAEEEILRNCDHLRLKLKLFSTCYAKEAGKAAAKLNMPKKSNRGRLLWMFQSLFRGIYSGQLINFAKHFPDKQILVIQSEEFYQNTPKVMKRIEQFLGLQHHSWENELQAKQVFNFGAKNKVYESDKGADYEPLAPETRARLEQLFEKYNDDFYKLFDNENSFPRW